MVQLLCSSGTSPPFVSGGGVFLGSSFLFALQFPLVRVCLGPTFRLAFCPQWGLIGIDSFCHCICMEGVFPFDSSPHHVLDGLSGLTFFGCLSGNFNAISLKSRQATSYFSPVYVCVLRLIFSSINPFYTLTKDPLNLVSLNAYPTFNCKSTYLL